MGAALQQRARMVHSGIPQILVLLRLGCRFSVDGAGSDLPVEGPVWQVEVAVDDLLAGPLEVELNAWSAGQHGVPIRDGCRHDHFYPVVLGGLGIDDDGRNGFPVPEASLIGEYRFGGFPFSFTILGWSDRGMRAGRWLQGGD